MGRVSLRLPNKIEGFLREMADDLGITLSDLIKTALVEFISDKVHLDKEEKRMLIHVMFKGGKYRRRTK